MSCYPNGSPMPSLCLLAGSGLDAQNERVVEEQQAFLTVLGVSGHRVLYGALVWSVWT